MAKILVVDDDPDSINMVSVFLANDKHLVESASDGLDAKIRMENSRYELIIMDWNLAEDFSGIDLIKDYRVSGGESPVLVLSGRTDYEDKAFGLDNGADDYICKPFHPRELSARVRALLRRSRYTTGRLLKVRNVELDSVAYKVSVEGRQIKLYPKEFSLLEFFMRHPNQVFSADKLLDAVWSTDSAATVESLRQVMMRLRSRLDSAGAGGLITTVYGIGYKLEDR